MGKKLLVNDKSKGSLPLGSHAGNVSKAFSEGHSFDCEGAGGDRKAPSTKNYANPSGVKASRKNASIYSKSQKDGQRQGGTPRISGKSRGPSGRSKKAKGVSGR